ncbi:MAG: glycosyl hydrolase, partial [Bacteroidota bacterium]
VDGKVTPLSDPVQFEVAPLHQPTLKGATADEYMAFSDQLSRVQNQYAAVSNALNESMDKVNAMMVAMERSDLEPGAMNEELYQLKQHIYQLDEQLNGNEARSEIGERNPPTVRSRMFVGYRGLSTTYGPTEMHRQSLDLAEKELQGIMKSVEDLGKSKIPNVEKTLQEAGAPYIEGQAIPKN